jgi:hypothetical protein
MVRPTFKITSSPALAIDLAVACVRSLRLFFAFVQSVQDLSDAGQHKSFALDLLAQVPAKVVLRRQRCTPL